MQTVARDRARAARARSAAPLFPPPPPMRLVRNTDEGPPAPVQPVDPRWLEEAVLRVLKKHSLVPAPAAVEWIEVDIPEPKPTSRLRRFLRAIFVLGLLALLAVSGAFAARWRYPAKAAAVVASAQGVLARVETTVRSKADPSWVAPVPSSPALPASTTSALPIQASTAPVVSAPAPTPVVARPSPDTLPPVSVSPPTSPAAAPAAVRTSSDASELGSPPAPEPRRDPKPAAHTTHAARAPRPATATAPVADGSAEAPAASPSPLPVPGSLEQAIRRAGGHANGNAATPPASELANAPEPTSSSNAAVPDRPSASAVKSALLGALPEARACMSAGDETKAVVVFESSGSVSAVQVSGASAACIQKALGRARVPPFSQPTYRAGVPIRSN
jgi:hypothetical protein